MLNNIISSLSAGTGFTGGLAGFGAALSAVPLWGWGIWAGLAALGPLIKWASGKKAWEAGAMELARDFGGLEIGQNAFQSWCTGLGLTEPKVYPIRKDLLSSPLFLTEVALPLAIAQGRLDSFIGSLAAVNTSWGNIDLQTGFLKWMKEGDPGQLNAAYSGHFATSATLQQNFPNWQSALMANRFDVPKAQEGGYVAEGGLAVIHKGETIIPAGGATINIHIDTVYGMDDLDAKIARSITKTYRSGGLSFLAAQPI
jgi:hypothetical protein